MYANLMVAAIPASPAAGSAYDLATTHALPALLRKIHEAKSRGEGVVAVWGSGRPRRDFLHLDDLADAVVFACERYDDELHLDVGTDEDVSIRDLVQIIADVVGSGGEFA